MKIILTTNNTPIKVDDNDYSFLMQWSWKLAGGGKGYASRTSRHGCIYMHRVLTGCLNNVEVDHKNGDPHDNRKYNLRIVSHLQNQRNIKRNKFNSSGVKGVTWSTQTNKWVVRMKVGDKNMSLGYFSDIKEASRVRKEAEDKYW